MSWYQNAKYKQPPFSYEIAAIKEDIIWTIYPEEKVKPLYEDYYKWVTKPETKNNYPNEKREEFIPDIIINNRYLAGYLASNNTNLKFSSSEKRDKNVNLILFDVIPIKLNFISKNDDIICAETNGKTLHLSCNDIERNWYNETLWEKEWQ